MTETTITPETEAEHLPALREHRGTDVASSLDERIRVAEVLAEAGMLPETYRGKRGNVLAAQFAADALQIPLFTAFQHLHVVKGKVGQSAELMRTLILRAGHTYTIQSDKTRATMTIQRADRSEPCLPVTFTIQDAVDAGLCRLKDGKVFSRSEKGEVKPWEAHTEAMLVARATSKAARMYTPEVLAGMGYTQDELEEAAGRITATVQQVPAEPQVNPAQEQAKAAAAAGERTPWTAETAAAALCGIDPADEDAKAKLTRLWHETAADRVRGHLVAGQPFGKHWMDAKTAILDRGESYCPDGVKPDPHAFDASDDDQGDQGDTAPADGEVVDAEIVDEGEAQNTAPNGQAVDQAAVDGAGDQ